ncbi:bifunctional phosphoribosylaminoimidazolecarboxamide formyltransferase/IMP cyclohydrolase [bacterium]|nr:bifunctional phosphoribosylaminoimidazolecarboxamide formyltransferase/IMP cyclohydrolase [bacterium]
MAAAPKKKVLISVADKRYLTTFARDLIKYGYEIYASGGTQAKLKEAGIPSKDISRALSAPEILGGRVKTLHVNVMASILADPANAQHNKDMTKLGLSGFSMVVVNFYPFSEKVIPGKTAPDAAVELVDIGGPTMVRAAAKNYKNVAVVSNVEQYKDVTRELKAGEGLLNQGFRMRLAAEAFACTAQYEQSIAAYFAHMAPKPAEAAPAAISSAESTAPAPKAKPAADLLPAKLAVNLRQTDSLRYGENPHQPAARYSADSLASVPFRFLQGKEMSYNNYHDASAALAVVSADYSRSCAACVVKHQNPCGAAIGDDPVKTFMEAWKADEESAFGGIIGLNFTVDAKVAAEIRRSFFEIVVAPGFDDAAKAELSSKKNLILLQASPADVRQVMAGTPRLTSSLFGYFLQGFDNESENWEQLNVVSQVQPAEKLREDILTGLRYVRFLKSNALCVVKDGVMVGAGLGQMSRVSACRIALENAGKRAAGAVLVSDGFFPFADSLELAAKAKVGCVVAPAGSKRDMEVVAAANSLKLPLVFCPNRHFLH